MHAIKQKPVGVLQPENGRRWLPINNTIVSQALRKPLNMSVSEEDVSKALDAENKYRESKINGIISRKGVPN
jgi:hypothetical protein